MKKKMEEMVSQNPTSKDEKSGSIVSVENSYVGSLPTVRTFHSRACDAVRGIGVLSIAVEASPRICIAYRCRYRSCRVMWSIANSGSVCMSRQGWLTARLWLHVLILWNNIQFHCVIVVIVIFFLVLPTLMTWHWRPSFRKILNENNNYQE